MTLPLYGLQFLQNLAGKTERIKYYTQTIGSVWDDDVALTQSGTNLWLNAIVLPLDNRNSEDAYLMEQGKVTDKDKKIFINGSVLLQTGSTSVKIQIGSPTGEQFYIIPDGVKLASWGTTDVFKKVYLRKLQNGSLYGEV